VVIDFERAFGESKKRGGVCMGDGEATDRSVLLDGFVGRRDVVRVLLLVVINTDLGG
jgi:hypothetical protein